MPGYIEDRWLNKRPDKVTGKRERTDRWGTKTKRYKVCGIPGVRARSFVEKEDAKTWWAKASNESVKGTFIDPRDGTILLDDYIREKWLPGVHGSPNTVRTIGLRLNHIRRELGRKQLREIDPAMLRAFIVTLTNRPLAPSYVRDILKTLTGILDTAIEDKRLVANPAASKTVSAPKDNQEKREAWPAKTLLAVLHGINPRYRVAVAIGAGCGLRQGEVFGLAEEDVDFENGVIHVRRQVQCDVTRRYFRLPKGGKTRSVDMPGSVAAEIRAHMRAYKPVVVALPWGKPEALERQQHALLVTTTQDGAIRAHSWNINFWKPVLAKAGVIKALEAGQHKWEHESARRDGFHVLRHTYASHQLGAGESVVTLARWLGHASPSITMDHYAHMIPGAGAKGRVAIDALLGMSPSPEPFGSPQGLPRAFKMIDGKRKMQVIRPRKPLLVDTVAVSAGGAVDQA